MSLLASFTMPDRVAVVTGSGQGIGRAIAWGLADAGCDVVVNARRLADLEVTAAGVVERGRRSLIADGDIVDFSEDLADRAVAEFGRLDVWVSNVGGSNEKNVRELVDTSDEIWRAQLELNLTSALPLIGRGGDAASLAVAGRLIAEERPDLLYSRLPDRLAVDDPAWQAEARKMGYSWRLYPYLYPPLIAYAAAPASGADLSLIRAAMLALTTCGAALSILLAARCWAPELLIPGWLIGVIAGAALFWPFISQLIALNLQPLVMLAILAAIAAAQAGRPALAGSALALAAAVKVTPAVLVLYWLATRRHAEALWFFIAGAGLVALGLVLAGAPLHLDWVRSMQELGQSIVPTEQNRSIAALLYGMAYGLEPSAEGLPLRPLPAWLQAACALAGLAGVALCLWGAPRSRHRPAADAAGQIALILVTVLATPLAWSHYFLILVPAAMVWTGLVGLTSRSVSVIALIAILISEPVTRVASAAAERGWPAVLAGFEPLAALILLVLLLRARRRYFRSV